LVKVIERNVIEFVGITSFLQSRIIQFGTQKQVVFQLGYYLLIRCFNLVFIGLHQVKYTLVMSKKQTLNTLNHSVFSLQYHLVFVTKYRRQCISPLMLERLKEIFQATVEKWHGELIEFNGETDHVHLLISLNPKLRLSDFVNNMKTVSSRLIRKDFAEELREVYWKPVFWSRSYCILTCGGAPLSVIKQYIENQKSID
jgi:putative transposase